MPVSPIVRDIEKLLKERHTSSSKDESAKMMDSMQGFISRLNMVTSVQRLMQDAARLVHSLFNYQEVSIGLRDPADGMFRYFAVLGYTKEAEDALKKVSYTLEEFMSLQEFPGIRISKMLEMMVGENQPNLEKEKKCWNRPAQLSDARKSPEDFTEADYLDVHLYAGGTDLVGWIEVSAPRDGKMPSGLTMKGLELFGSILAIAVQYHLSRSNDRSIK